MPALDTKTEFVFRRVQMMGTSNATALGPLILPVSRELRNRKLYFSVNWQGYTDWKATATLGLFNGNTALETFRLNWGSIYSNQASVNTWANTLGEVGVNSGGPSYSVQIYDPGAFPNGPHVEGPDSVLIFGMSQVDGVTETAYSTLMQPFSWFGSIDNIRFQWLDVSGRFSATPSVTAAPFAEVYLGCKSIVG